MSCSKPKCRVKGDEPMVSCWLCNAVYHAKCVELAHRTADNLCEDKGLRWCCKKCIVYDVEFFSFFKNTRLEFDSINSDLNCLTKKFLKFKELFDKASCSPKRKKSTTDVITGTSSKNFNTACNTVGTVPNNLQHPVPSTSTVFNSPHAQPQVPISSDPSSKNSSTLQLQNSQNSQSIPSFTFVPENLPSPIIPVQNQTALTSDVPVFNPANVPATRKVISPSPAADTRNRNLNSVTSNSTANQSPYNGLKIIPPNKSIFISRFAADTTVEQINFYIKSKLNLEADFTTYKFSYSQPRRITSFKLNVPFDLYEQIVNPDFWPKNTLVREYVFKENQRKNNIAVLPSGHQLNENANFINVQKN